MVFPVTRKCFKRKLKQAEGKQLDRLSRMSLRSVGCVHARESRRANRWKSIVKAAKMDFCGIISLLGINPTTKPFSATSGRGYLPANTEGLERTVGST